MTSVRISRRTALAAAAALPIGATLRPMEARAAAEMKGGSVPAFNRFKLGEMEVTALLAGTRTVEKPTEIFGLNVAPEEFATVSHAAFLPTDKAQFFFTPTLVNTGKELVLFDTGMAPEGMTTALAAAGYSPDEIDVVVLTHMHPDHIGGLMSGGTPTFAKARYVTGSAEHNFWSGSPSELFTANVVPLNDRMTFLDDGGTVTGGITAKLAPGHTPGHMAFLVESGGQTLAITADTANHYVWSLAHPDWEVRFDADKPKAAQTRRDVFGMIAADRIPFIGYHMPFPAMGYVEAQGDGFRYVPASYQMMLSN